ncbi:MAG: UDP-N-acetylglucosamine 1-carboxyvinyltransferase [Acidobacteriota bacterium]|nr:MAG: UDP-N-acetylglucosamine 1-carboxyvinyltransferase [Acidobacteriota bacterium]
MDRLRIVGGRRLAGKLHIGGAKNASLPAMAASLLTDQPVHLANLPDVWDVGTMRRLLLRLGTSVTQPSLHEISLTTAKLTSPEASYELVKTMRASVLVLGPLLARHGRAHVSLPGGCAIGARPIDQHIAGLEKLGARINLDHGFIDAETDGDGLTGATIHFDNVTVGGTENLMMAACLARGETVLENCAREPEIVDLAELLTGMGAIIEGAGTARIRVEGVARLGGTTHSIIPDRIEAATYLIAGALTGDDVELRDCRPEHLGELCRALRDIGVPVEIGDGSVRVLGADCDLRALDIETAPYPGFATDMQAQIMVLLTQASGESRIVETIFENRFMHVAELSRMGSRIDLHGNHATVAGPTPLSAANVMATDLRASACLVLAGLVAEGETIIDRIYHLDRGYEHIEEKLKGLGAEVERVV